MILLNKESLERVEEWLMNREKTCTTEQVAAFLVNPTKERIDGAQQLYKLFRAEIANEIQHPLI